jgi:hypothetical protein
MRREWSPEDVVACWTPVSVALFVDGGQRAGQGRDHDVEGAGPGHDDGLLVEGVEDVVRAASAMTAASLASVLASPG